MRRAIVMLLVVSLAFAGLASPIKSMMAMRNSTITEATEIPYASEVEWIYVDGPAYCDTGLAFTPSSNYVMQLDFQYPDGWIVNSHIFGVRAGSSPYFDVNVGTSFLKVRTTPNRDATYGTMDRRRHSITVDAVNDHFILDDDERSLVYPISSYQSSNHVILFYFTLSAVNVKMRVYSFKVWNREGILVKDLVPYRVGIGTEAVGCFFDKANPNGGVNGDGLFFITGTATIEVGRDKK